MKKEDSRVKTPRDLFKENFQLGLHFLLCDVNSSVLFLYTFNVDSFICECLRTAHGMVILTIQSIQSLFPYKKYTNIKKHQNNKETKYGGKDRKANEA